MERRLRCGRLGGRDGEVLKKGEHIVSRGGSSFDSKDFCVCTAANF
jgi:hypothetical protein